MILCEFLYLRPNSYIPCVMSAKCLHPAMLYLFHRPEYLRPRHNHIEMSPNMPTYHAAPPHRPIVPPWPPPIALRQCPLLPWPPRPAYDFPMIARFHAWHRHFPVNQPDIGGLNFPHLVQIVPMPDMRPIFPAQCYRNLIYQYCLITHGRPVYPRHIPVMRKKSRKSSKKFL